MVFLSIILRESIRHAQAVELTLQHEFGGIFFVFF